MPCGSVFSLFCVWIHGNPRKSMEKYKIDTTKFNLLPNERLESFWDALWLGIRTFLCFKMSNWSQLGASILKPVSAHPKPVLSGMSNRFQFIQNRFQNRFQTGFNENRFHRNRFHCKPFGGRFHRKPVSVTGFRFDLRPSCVVQMTSWCTLNDLRM